MIRATRAAISAFSSVAVGLACAGASTSAEQIPGPNLSRALVTADSLVGAAVGTLVPGAVLVVAQNGKILRERSFGYAQLNDYEGKRLSDPRLMRTSTLFDLASVTKVLGTTLAVMVLNDRGLVDLDASSREMLPAPARGGSRDRRRGTRRPAKVP